MMGFKTFSSAKRTLSGIKAMNYDAETARHRTRGQCLSSQIYRSNLWSACLKERERLSWSSKDFCDTPSNSSSGKQVRKLTMGAARMQGYNQPLVLEDVPQPDIQPDEILV